MFVYGKSSIPELSFASIVAMAEKCPFVVLDEAPDAHSASGRRGAAVAEELPKNVLMPRSRCGAHQCHRVVASTEKQVIGDFHAIHVTCSHYSNSSKISNALYKLLDSVDFSIGIPDPGVQQVHLEISRCATVLFSRFVAALFAVLF